MLIRIPAATAEPITPATLLPLFGQQGLGHAAQSTSKQTPFSVPPDCFLLSPIIQSPFSPIPLFPSKIAFIYATTPSFLKIFIKKLPAYADSPSVLVSYILLFLPIFCFTCPFCKKGQPPLREAALTISPGYKYLHFACRLNSFLKKYHSTGPHQLHRSSDPLRYRLPQQNRIQSCYLRW